MAPSKKSAGKKKKSGAKKAKSQKEIKLRFDATDIINKLKKDFKGTVDTKAGIYLAGVMEYFLAELVELTQNAANERRSDQKNVRATVEDLIKAIESDEELKATVDLSSFQKST